MSVQLHYQIYGEGPPLYILHGLFGSHRNWLSISRQLTDNRQIVAIDLRNHGASGHADTMSYPEMTADIIQLISELGHDQVDLMGHSMGGKAAMTLALIHPDRVKKLIVVDIAPIRYQLNHDELITALRSIVVDKLESRADADAALAGEIPDTGLRQYLLQNLIRDDKGFRWRLNLDAIHVNHGLLRDFPQELAGRHWSGPALFLSGDQSDFVLPEYTIDIKRHFPAAQQHVIAGANHWVHADKPAEVVSAVSAFLNK